MSFIQGIPGNDGPRGEPGDPGCNGTKVLICGKKSASAIKESLNVEF